LILRRCCSKDNVPFKLVACHKVVVLLVGGARQLYMIVKEKVLAIANTLIPRGEDASTILEYCAAQLP
jgi:hypothetical protein